MEEGTLGTAWAPRGPSCSGEKGQVEWVKPAGGGGFSPSLSPYREGRRSAVDRPCGLLGWLGGGL